MTENSPTNEQNGNGDNPKLVILADDNKILRTGLRELLEKQPQIRVVAEAEDGRTAVQLSQRLSPDIVIMDISMQDLNGIEATRQIIGSGPQTKVIILSMHSGQKMAAEVFKAGASGYLLKDCDFGEMFYAIRTVMAGETYLCPQIATVLRNDYLQRLLKTDGSIASSLTPREKEVLQLIAEGKSTKEIAFAFNLSVKTVEVHRQRIMEKLKIHSIAELTKYAIREGLTSLDH
jgi:DNA-binding NarL/FixJ family response regulator